MTDSAHANHVGSIGRLPVSKNLSEAEGEWLEGSQLIARNWPYCEDKHPHYLNYLQMSLRCQLSSPSSSSFEVKKRVIVGNFPSDWPVGAEALPLPRRLSTFRHACGRIVSTVKKLTCGGLAVAIE
jgi:hypothetical protein